jgi:hypothetical protein
VFGEAQWTVQLREAGVVRASVSGSHEMRGSGLCISKEQTESPTPLPLSWNTTSKSMQAKGIFTDYGACAGCEAQCEMWTAV